jgi:hypothetical protein
MDAANAITLTGIPGGLASVDGGTGFFFRGELLFFRIERGEWRRDCEWVFADMFKS